MKQSAPSAAPGHTLDASRTQALIAPLYADRLLDTGEPMAAHALGLADIVRHIRPDPDLMCAAELFGVHDVVREPDRWVKSHFGASVAQLVNDLRHLRQLSESVRARLRSAADAADGDPAAQEEALRRMLLAMVNDIRVVLLRLGSRLQSLRYLVSAVKQARDAGKTEDPVFRLAQEYAQETRVLLAPLANRLGVWQFKWELEDLALRVLEPQVYQDLARRLEEKRVHREARVREVVDIIDGLLRDAGVSGAVSGRPKHMASIAAKMKAKRLGFDQIMDQRAVRVVVERVDQCYEVLALVHHRWRPVANEMDDYIAKPKANGYQSLHTVVEDDDGRPLEVQIRTDQMHDFAEHGVAAHWRYKEGGGGESAETQKVAWLRRLLDWQRDVDVGAGPVANDRVYALTPQGRVIELPQGATAIDFAYHLHTELGHRCRGARIDGALVALTTPLRTGQTVEIVSARSGGPSRDWLNPELGFLASPRSRAKVRQWFHAQEFELSVASGRDIITRELQRQGRTAVSLEELARKLGFSSIDELCAAANSDEFHLRSIEQALADTPEPAAPPEDIELRRPAAAAGRGTVLVVGVDSLLTNLARCCRPIPPDPIVGFVTRGKGISVHRSRCANAKSLMQRQADRFIEVQWDAAAGLPAKGAGAVSTFPVEISVLAMDRQGLLRDISEVFARQKLNVIGVNTVSQRDQAHMTFTVEVPDNDALRIALNQLAEVKGVVIARRKS